VHYLAELCSTKIISNFLEDFLRTFRELLRTLGELLKTLGELLRTLGELLRTLGELFEGFGGTFEKTCNCLPVRSVGLVVVVSCPCNL
jgi:hypothetical protein